MRSLLVNSGQYVLLDWKNRQMAPLIMTLSKPAPSVNAMHSCKGPARVWYRVQNVRNWEAQKQVQARQLEILKSKKANFLHYNVTTLAREYPVLTLLRYRRIAVQLRSDLSFPQTHIALTAAQSARDLRTVSFVGSQHTTQVTSTSSARTQQGFRR
jgi:hypothetical protein